MCYNELSCVDRYKVPGYFNTNILLNNLFDVSEK